ncbi:16911_t:CDS:2 [Entrophospora sp. SA101]|nr:16911_t:CDS:2 [Entrophospora sp. SA101]
MSKEKNSSTGEFEIRSDDEYLHFSDYPEFAVNIKERNSNGTFGIKKTKELNDSSVEALKHGDNDIIWEEKDIEQIESDDSLTKILDDEVEWAAEGSQKITDFFQSKESENLPAKFIDGFCKLLNSENGISLEMIGVNLTA